MDLRIRPLDRFNSLIVAIKIQYCVIEIKRFLFLVGFLLIINYWTRTTNRNHLSISSLFLLVYFSVFSVFFLYFSLFVYKFFLFSFFLHFDPLYFFCIYFLFILFNFNTFFLFLHIFYFCDRASVNHIVSSSVIGFITLL